MNKWKRRMGMLIAVAALIGSGGCLGPNPLFFITSTAATATIMRLVNTILDGVLAAP